MDPYLPQWFPEMDFYQRAADALRVGVPEAIRLWRAGERTLIWYAILAQEGKDGAVHVAQEWAK